VWQGPPDRQVFQVWKLAIPPDEIDTEIAAARQARRTTRLQPGS